MLGCVASRRNDGHMSQWLIALVSLIYFLASLGLLIEGKYGLALFCLGCTVANCGLMIAAR